MRNYAESLNLLKNKYNEVIASHGQPASNTQSTVVTKLLLPLFYEQYGEVSSGWRRAAADKLRAYYGTDNSQNEDLPQFRNKLRDIIGIEIDASFAAAASLQHDSREVAYADKFTPKPPSRCVDVLLSDDKKEFDKPINAYNSNKKRSIHEVFGGNSDIKNSENTKLPECQSCGNFTHRVDVCPFIDRSSAIPTLLHPDAVQPDSATPWSQNQRTVVYKNLWSNINDNKPCNYLDRRLKLNASMTALEFMSVPEIEKIRQNTQNTRSGDQYDSRRSGYYHHRGSNFRGGGARNYNSRGQSSHYGRG